MILNDEQILLKTIKLLENLNDGRGFGEGEPPKDKKSREWYKKQDIYLESDEKLLREITEDELEVIQDILSDLKGEDLAFNELFDGKMRKVIDFPTMDTESKLGQFVEELKTSLKLTVDWEKGMVSVQREWQENSIENDEAFVSSIMGAGEIKKVNKKFQMKIGKYFAKLDKLLQDYKKMRKKIAHEVWEGRQDNSWGASFSIGQIQDALSTDELKRLYQIQNGLELYAGTDAIHALNKYYTGFGEAEKGNHTKIPKLAQYWQENAGYIKKEINNLENDKYSMIITRHPIDVLRMSDFDKIYSCHSPPSRETQHTSFYKCAVAESKGHGALAYVVETDDLLHMTGTSNIESAEQEIQEGEIFADEIRGSHVGLYDPDRALEPKSRVRLRQMRYYDTDEPKRWDEGTELAVPVPRVYGAGIPGISTRITDWARENQEEALKKMPSTNDDNEDVNLDRFWIFGGTHADFPGATGRKQLLSKLAMIETAAMTGEIRQNQDTEDEIDVNLLGSAQLQWEAEVTEIEEEWNRRYAVTIVEPWVEDDGEGGLNIQARWSVVLDWDMDEFARLPNSYPTAPEAADYINEYQGDIFDPQHAFLNKTTINGEDKVRWGCRVNLEHPDVLNEEYFYDPDSLNEACQKIDINIDDKRDLFKALLEEFFKQDEEGWMEGGEYIKLAAEIEDGPFESYEWDVRYDGEHSTESYEATAAVSHDFDHEELGVSPEVLKKILDSRDWNIAIRTALLASAQEALGTEYHLDIEKTNASISGSEHVGYLVDYEITFRITSDDPDERVKLFRELTTGEDSDMDDADNLKAAFEGVMAQFLNSRQPSHMQQNLDERLVRNWKQFIGR